jgi:hypothetical protein
MLKIKYYTPIFRELFTVILSCVFFKAEVRSDVPINGYQRYQCLNFG